MPLLRHGARLERRVYRVDSIARTRSGVEVPQSFRALVSPDPKAPGNWRVTLLWGDAGAEPVGHISLAPTTPAHALNGVIWHFVEQVAQRSGAQLLRAELVPLENPVRSVETTSTGVPPINLQTTPRTAAVGDLLRVVWAARQRLEIEGKPYVDCTGMGLSGSIAAFFGMRRKDDRTWCPATRFKELQELMGDISAELERKAPQDNEHGQDVPQPGIDSESLYEQKRPALSRHHKRTAARLHGWLTPQEIPPGPYPTSRPLRGWGAGARGLPVQAEAARRTGVRGAGRAFAARLGADRAAPGEAWAGSPIRRRCHAQ